jgi:hypothetical protein
MERPWMRDVSKFLFEMDVCLCVMSRGHGVIKVVICGGLKVERRERARRSRRDVRESGTATRASVQASAVCTLSTLSLCSAVHVLFTSVTPHSHSGYEMASVTRPPSRSLAFSYRESGRRLRLPLFCALVLWLHHVGLAACTGSQSTDMISLALLEWVCRVAVRSLGWVCGPSELYL